MTKLFEYLLRTNFRFGRMCGGKPNADTTTE